MATPVKNHLSDERLQQLQVYAESFKKGTSSEQTLSHLVVILIEELKRYRFKEVIDET